jgi:hydrogenase/urease accessory protein HupE
LRRDCTAGWLLALEAGSSRVGTPAVLSRLVFGDAASVRAATTRSPQAQISWRSPIIIRLAIVAASFTGACLVPEAALAHAPIKGIGTFYNGVLHPVLVPAHLLTIFGLGLLLGQHAPQASRVGWFSFVVAFWAGLAGTRLGYAVPDVVLLALALCAGLLVALDRIGHLGIAFVLAAAAGFCLGLDSAPEGIAEGERWLALLGTATGGVLLISYVGGFAAGLVRPWQRIGVRIAGSWTAAGAGIVLALALAGPQTTGLSP